MKFLFFEDRFKILQEVFFNINDRFEGKVSNLIHEAKNDAQKLLKLIVQNFPSFSDISKYKGKDIFFYKRAQLFAADIYRIFKKNRFFFLKNIDQVTAFADYKLPQILRSLKIIKYSQSLADIIDNKIELVKNSPEEIEIRANTIWAVELIKEKNRFANFFFSNK